MTSLNSTKQFWIDQRRLDYGDVGAGYPIVLLHGNDTSEKQWNNQIPVLVAAGYRVICPHRAGFGKSDPHQGLPGESSARDMWALLDYLKIDQVVLVGHSAGAGVLKQMLCSRPDAVDAVVSVDSVTFGKLDVEKMGPERFDEKTAALYEKYKDTLAEMGRLWDYPSRFNVEQLNTVQKITKSRKRNRPKPQNTPEPQDITGPKGKWIKVPLLVFTAGRGKVRPDDPEAMGLQDQLPSEDATLVIVTDSGHWIHKEQIRLFNDKLLEFLASLPTCANNSQKSG